jgi:hypothetical protein
VLVEDLPCQIVQIGVLATRPARSLDSPPSYTKEIVDLYPGERIVEGIDPLEDFPGDSHRYPPGVHGAAASCAPVHDVLDGHAHLA